MLDIKQSTRSLARQDNWYESVQKRKDDMARVVDDTRKRLEALGWQSVTTAPTNHDKGIRSTGITKPQYLKGIPEFASTNNNESDKSASKSSTLSTKTEVILKQTNNSKPSVKPVPTARSTWSKVAPDPISINDADSGVSSIELGASHSRELPSPPDQLPCNPISVVPKPRKPRQKYTQRRSTEPLFTSDTHDSDTAATSVTYTNSANTNHAEGTVVPTYQKLIQASKNITNRQHHQDGKVFYRLKEPLYLKQTKSSQAKVSSNIDNKKVRGRLKHDTNSFDNASLDRQDYNSFNDDDSFSSKSAKKEKSKLSRSLCASVPNLATCYEDDDEEVEEVSNLQDNIDLSKSVPDLNDDDTSSCVSVGTTSSSFTENEEQLPKAHHKSIHPAHTSVKSPHVRRLIAPRKKNHEMTLDQAKNILLGKSGIWNSKNISLSSHESFIQSLTSPEDKPLQKSSISKLNLRSGKSFTLPRPLNSTSIKDSSHVSTSRSQDSKNSTQLERRLKNSVSAGNIDKLSKENGDSLVSKRKGSLLQTFHANSFDNDVQLLPRKTSSKSGEFSPSKSRERTLSGSRSFNISLSSTLTPKLSDDSVIVNGPLISGPLTSTPEVEEKGGMNRRTLAPSLRIQRKMQNQPGQKATKKQNNISTGVTDSDDEPISVTPSKLKSSSGQIVLPWENKKEEHINSTVSPKSSPVSQVSVDAPLTESKMQQSAAAIDQSSSSTHKNMLAQRTESVLSPTMMSDISEAISTLKRDFLHVSDLCSVVMTHGTDTESEEIAKMLSENLQETQKSLVDLSSKLASRSETSCEKIKQAEIIEPLPRMFAHHKSVKNLTDDQLSSSVCSLIDRSMNTSLSEDGKDIAKTMSFMEPVLQQYNQQLMENIKEMLRKHQDQ